VQPLNLLSCPSPTCLCQLPPFGLPPLSQSWRWRRPDCTIVCTEYRLLVKYITHSSIMTFRHAVDRRLAAAADCPVVGAIYSPAGDFVDCDAMSVCGRAQRAVQATVSHPTSDQYTTDVPALFSIGLSTRCENKQAVSSCTDKQPGTCTLLPPCTAGVLYWQRSAHRSRFYYTDKPSNTSKQQMNFLENT